MLYNLIDNAIKYSGERGSVRVGLEAGDGAARVSVADTGPGIPAEDQGRLFERFYRADQSRARDTAGGIGGAGLGLAIALWVARSHGGNIEVESRLGEGSTFRVVLPLQGTG
jgi:two-component system sensor histidine kinase SenX3